jgi:hypothetical protein
MNVNYASSIVNKLGDSLTDDARVVNYDRRVFIFQATGTTFTKLYFFVTYEWNKLECLSPESLSGLV